MASDNLSYCCSKYHLRSVQPLCGKYEMCEGCIGNPNCKDPFRDPLSVIESVVKKRLPEKYWETATPDMRTVNRYLDSGSYWGAEMRDEKWHLPEDAVTIVIRPWDIGPRYLPGKKKTTDADFEEEAGMTRRHARRLGFQFDYWNGYAWTFTNSCHAFSSMHKREGR
jgi:hypothetical protein